MTLPNYLTIFKILFFVGLLFTAGTSFAATLSISPNTGVYTAGQTFTTRVLVNTTGQNINAAEGTISFKPTELSVVRVSKGSVFNLWTAEPSFSNTAGTISFSGGTPTGYSGSAGTVLTITFRIKGAGNPRVSFANGAVLAADGRGTNVLTSMNGASYTIAAADVIPEPETIKYIASANTPDAPSIVSETHTDPQQWYPVNTAELSWKLPSGVIAVRTLLDENSGSIPTKVYNKPISKITIADLDEGEQYFHLQFKNSDGWGRVTHYRLAVDSQKPESFDISLSEGADLSNPVQTLLLNVEDATSEVARFLVQVDSAEPYEYTDSENTKQLTMESLDPGYHTVIIEAFDEAGNSIISTFSLTILAFDKPKFTEYPSELSQQVIPVIKGITRPNSEVRVSLTKLGSDTQEVVLQSEASGEFIFIPDSRFSLGVYELSAVAVDQYGAQSEVSDTIRIAVQEPGYIRIGSLAVNILSIFIPVLALLAFVIFGIWFLLLRLKKIRSGVTRETKEALLILHSEFDNLQKVLEEKSLTLASTRKTKKLTKAEFLLVESIKDAMHQAQQKVQKEIIDVEHLVE